MFIRHCAAALLVIALLPASARCLGLVEAVDGSTHAQDGCATIVNAVAPGEHFSPDGTNRFGTCALSSGVDLGCGSSAQFITADSIVIEVTGVSNLASLHWYGAIVSGPHAGKALAPYAVGPNGFFTVTPDQCRDAATGNVIPGKFYVDLDDTYFRGGDVLLYYWSATDLSGNTISAPPGLTSVATSVASAEAATGGLFEVSWLPVIDWAPSYLARIQADASGDLHPTTGELAASTQRNRILYVQGVEGRRRSGTANRTEFMKVLDAAGYSGQYDVFDVQAGNPSNFLGGRANVGQVTGYAMIIQDAGASCSVVLPDGSDNCSNKINQAGWYHSYLAQGSTGLAGLASLWLMGDNLVQVSGAPPLLGTDCGVVYAGDEPQDPKNASGAGTYTFPSGQVANFATSTITVATDPPHIVCAGGSDFYSSQGTAVVTHRWPSASAAVVMNKNNALKWATIVSAFTWDSISFSVPVKPGAGAPSPTDNGYGRDLALQIVRGASGVAPASAGIPTMSQWGLILFLLLLLAAGSTLFRQESLSTGYAGGQGAALVQERRLPPLVWPVYRRALVATMAAAIAGLALARVSTGEVAVTDVVGALACAPVLAYTAHIWILEARRSRGGRP